MKVLNSVRPLVFEEEGNLISIEYDNRGEPFREGVQIRFRPEEYPGAWACVTTVLLNGEDVVKLRDKLNEFINPEVD